MNKAELREFFKQQRGVLSAEDRDALSMAVFKKFFQVEGLSSRKYFHVFLPILRQNEVNTWPIVRLLWQHGKKVIVPVSDFQRGTLSHYFLDEDTPLRENKMGVPEPRHAKMAEERHIEVVVLPLLAFDLRGYRVGYGKGFYDKFVGGLSRQVIKIGVSLFDPVDAIKGVDDWDVPLDYCVTPKQVYSF